MASSLLRSNPSVFSSSYSSSSPTKPKTIKFTIQCGPRDNRGPLQKGRILSTEAMHAIQALKRFKTDETKLATVISKSISRLTKPDLIASLNELLRQNHPDLALKVFSTVRSEFWYKPDCSLYADLVSALARNGLVDEIDGLVRELEGEGMGEDDCKGVSKLIKALVAAERSEAVVKVYGVMRKCGWECRDDSDEYVVKVLSRGLRRLGQPEVADEVEREFCTLERVN